MGTVAEVAGGMQAAQAGGAANASRTANASGTTKTAKVSGRTIGNPQLSEEGAKYYEELKKKFSNMDFILVSSDQKENAKAMAGSFANPNRMVVLIDEEKIERMATDANYRKQYEGIIAQGANGLSQLAQKMAASGANVKGYGMQVKDGRASFFAVMDKSFADQRARMQKRIAEKKEAKKAEAKKADQKAAEKKRQERIESRKTEKSDREQDVDPLWDEKDSVIITASSIDELMKKVEDYNFALRSDNVRTEMERQMGQSIDYRT